MIVALGLIVSGCIPVVPPAEQVTTPAKTDGECNVTVELRDSNNMLITNSGATIIYQPGSSGAYVNFGDGAINADGTETAVVPAGRHRFCLTYQNCTQEKQLWVGEGSIVTYQTHLVTVELKNSSGNLIQNFNATISWQPGSSGSYVQFGSNAELQANGQTSMETLPLTHRFRMTYLGTTQEKQTNSATVTYQTRLVTVELRDASNNLVTGNNATIVWQPGGSGSYVPFGSNAELQNKGWTSMETLPLTNRYRMTYLGKTKEKQSDATIVTYYVSDFQMNQPPVLDPIGDKTVNEGELLSFTISATDPDGNVLTYSTSKLPTGATFTAGTKVFSWTPGYDQTGTYPGVHFEVSDGSLVDSEEITITVVNIDKVAPSGSITINSNAVYTKSTNVTLNLSATDAVGVTGYRVSNGTDASGASTVTVSSTISFIADILWSILTVDDTKTVAVQYCDAVGNWSPNYTDSIIMDQTPPTLTWGAITPTPNADGWNNTEVTITFTTDDNLSGVASTSLSSPLTFTSEGQNQTQNVTVMDNAGNSATFTSPVVNIDWMPPVVIVTLPNSGVYLLNQVVSATWSATDNLSGVIPPKTGTIPIDTSSVGTKTLTVPAGTAVDYAGNPSAVVTANYSVVYAYSGILPPINEDGSSIFKLGSTVPVKFQLRDADGYFVTNAVAKIYLLKISNSVVPNGEIEAVSTSAATTGNLFRYSSDGNQYIFNLATKGLSTGTWRIRIELNDGTSKYVNISLK
jgi:hypothetical protein